MNRLLIQVSILVGFFLFGSLSIEAQGYKGVGYKKSGFSAIPEVGVYIPSNIFNNGFNVQLSLGARAGEHWFLGAGAACDVFQTYPFVTGFADVRWFLLAGEYSPFFALNAGYAYGLEEGSSGIAYHPKAGMRYMLSRSTDMHLSVGYRIQMIPSGFRGPADGQGQTDQQFSAFTIQMGLQF